MSDKFKTSIFEDDGQPGPAGWVPGDPTEEEMQQIVEYLATESGFLQFGLIEEKMNQFAHHSTGVWEWDDYQIYFFDTLTSFICNKCRQSGGSAMLAAKFFVRGILSDVDYNGIFTSYKKEEAINKVDYVKRYLDALPPRFRKKIIRDPLQLIEFENYNSTRVKILSHAQKPIRGINGDVGLDELGFYQWDAEVYSSALPATGMVGGDINIISTPFGKSGVFYDIFTDAEKYPDYKRLPIYWWYCRRYLKNPSDEFYAYAIKNAPKMNSTEERVFSLGSNAIKRQFQNAKDLETFKQEFEGLFVDEQAAFFSKDLILNCMYPETSYIDDYDPKEEDFNIPIEEALEMEKFPLINRYEGRKTINGNEINFKKYDSLEKLYAAVRRGAVSRNLVAGADVGTTYHSSYLTILEEVSFPDGSTLQIERFSMRRHKWDLPDQNQFYDHMLRQGFIRKLYLDSTGIGQQMGQSLKKKHPTRFKPFSMGGSNNKQEMLMTNLKNRMEQLCIALSYDREVIEDLYSLERHITQNKNISFRADEKQKSHADAAWAIGLASIAGTPFGEEYLNLGTIDDGGLGVTEEDFEEMCTLKTKNPIESNPELENTSLGLWDDGDLSEYGPVGDMAHPGGFISDFDL